MDGRYMFVLSLDVRDISQEHDSLSVVLTTKSSLTAVNVANISGLCREWSWNRTDRLWITHNFIPCPRWRPLRKPALDFLRSTSRKHPLVLDTGHHQHEPQTTNWTFAPHACVADVVNIVDPFFSAAALHFNQMFERYGIPIIALSLIKVYPWGDGDWW